MKHVELDELTFLHDHFHRSCATLPLTPASTMSQSMIQSHSCFPKDTHTHTPHVLILLPCARCLCLHSSSKWAHRMVWSMLTMGMGDHKLGIIDCVKQWCRASRCTIVVGQAWSKTCGMAMFGATCAMHVVVLVLCKCCMQIFVFGFLHMYMCDLFTLTTLAQYGSHVSKHPLYTYWILNCMALPHLP